MRLYADGINYYVELHQSNKNKPYLLMLHGFMGSGNAFSHLIAPLSEFCNPLTIDLAGHGKTETPADESLFTTERQINQVLSILNRISFDNLFLYGYSMGGRLAFQLAGNHPEYFKGAIIESAHCGIQDEDERDQRRELDFKRAEKIRTDFKNFLDEWLKMPLFTTDKDDHSEHYFNIMKEQNPKLLSVSLQQFGAGVMPSVCEKLKQIDLPVHLIAGENDKKYVKLLSSTSELNQNFTFHKAPDSGHRVHIDRPKVLLSLIKSTISKS